MQNQTPGVCPKCSQKTLYHNTGISQKNNRPYENYKCNNQQCGFIQWIAQENKPNTRAISPAPTSLNPPSQSPVEKQLDEIMGIMIRLENKFDNFLRENLGGE